ncbi:hypothetical protein AAY473_038896, partial [Plecturocebus cupreus]
MLRSSEELLIAFAVDMKKVNSTHHLYDIWEGTWWQGVTQDWSPDKSPKCDLHEEQLGPWGRHLEIPKYDVIICWEEALHLWRVQEAHHSGFGEAKKYLEYYSTVILHAMNSFGVQECILKP